MPAGRPTKYIPDKHPALAYEFCAEYGLTDKKLAKFFMVDVSNLQEWKKLYPEFRDSIRAGKDDYDSEAIEKSLRRRSIGFRYTETTKELSPTTELTELGNEVPGPSKLITTKTVRKFIPPDTKAIEFWLRNRKSMRWQDRQQIDIGGALGINVNEMSPEYKPELKELAAIRSELALRERREDGN